MVAVGQDGDEGRDGDGGGGAYNIENHPDQKQLGSNIVDSDVIRALLSKEINIVKKWLRPFSALKFKVNKLNILPQLKVALNFVKQANQL